jgi:sugar lactone lactonase YvrE
VVYLTESSANTIHAVTIDDPNDSTTWTIAPFANSAGTAGFRDGAAATARFRNPTGLYFDAATRLLYVADTGNHAIRAIDVTNATVSTVAGTPGQLGFAGDSGAATAARLYAPQAITVCHGDLFVADTGNNRVRRVDAGTAEITTVLGNGIAVSSGDGMPASSSSVDTPLGLACDALGNLFVTSTTTVRQVPADDSGVVDGHRAVQTIYGMAHDSFPENTTRCLSGIVVIDATTVEIADSCSGLLIDLHRIAK